MTEVVRLSYKGRYVTGLMKDARKWRYVVTPSDQHMIVREIALNARGVEPLFFKEVTTDGGYERAVERRVARSDDIDLAH